MKNRIFSFSTVIFFLIFCSFLLGLIGLDNAYFWDDEAQVAIIAKNFLKSGELTGWDGRNLYAYRNGSILDNSLNTRNPPLDVLITAFSFKLFGTSTWSARFLFVLFGISTIPLMISLVRENNLSHTPTMLLFWFLPFVLSTVYLLNIRQCRYYSLTLFFSMLSYFGYRKFMYKKGKKYLIILLFSSCFLFFSNYLLACSFLFILCVVHFTFHFKEAMKRDSLFTFACMMVAFLLITLPYSIHKKIWVRPDLSLANPSQINVSWLKFKFITFGRYIVEVNDNAILPWPFIFLFIYILIKNFRKEKALMMEALEWIVLGVGYLFFISLMSEQPLNVPVASRYLIVSLPYLTGIVGVCVWIVYKWRKIIGCIVLVTLIVCNIFTLNYHNSRFRWLLPAYIIEQFYEYPTGFSKVSEYIEEKVGHDDFVFCYPTFYNYPVMFYQGDKVLFAGLLDKRTTLPVKKIKKLTPFIFREERAPDWLFSFGLYSHTSNMLNYFSNIRTKDEYGEDVKYSLVDTLDVYYGDTQRPEIGLHHFGPKKKFDLKKKGVYVFKRERSTY